MKKYYINSVISYCYACDYSRITKDYGVLQEYMGKQYTRKQMDKIICELITKRPYVDNSPHLDINIMWGTEKIEGYYFMLTFTNDNYRKQPKGDLTIKYEKN